MLKINNYKKNNLPVIFLQHEILFQLVHMVSDHPPMDHNQIVYVQKSDQPEEIKRKAIIICIPVILSIHKRKNYKKK